VFGQTIPVEEVIVLDDCSTDDSAVVASRVAAEWGRDIRLLVNDANSGSVFAQWRRGVEIARGDWIWIAEADDEADPDLLATLADRLAAAPDAIMAFCDSRPVDEGGAPLGSDYKPYYVEAGAAALERDGLFRARDFARAFLAERNLVLNASAALFRRTALQAALGRCGEELVRFRLAGDWRLYLELLAEADGTVAYVAAPLNRHRRHSSSVTRETGNIRHAREIAQLHGLVRERLDPSPALRARQDAFRERVAAGK
jgi:glycosyltransferase involved in cell wall biosynthesis